MGDKKNLNSKLDQFNGDVEEGQEVCDKDGKCYIKTDKGFIEKDKEHTRENKTIYTEDGRQLLT